MINNFTDIVNALNSLEDIDNVIELLKEKKQQQTAGNTFKSLFKKGYLLEIQYDDNCLVYADRLISVDVAGKNVSYKFGMFGTDGQITFTLITKLNERDFNFTTKIPYAVIFDALVFNNGDGKNPHVAKGLVVCKLERGVYNEKTLVPVENDVLRCLAENRDKVQAAINNEAVNPVQAYDDFDGCDFIAPDMPISAPADMRIFTPESIEESIEEKVEDSATSEADSFEEVYPEHEVDDSILTRTLIAIENWINENKDDDTPKRILAVDIEQNSIHKSANSSVSRRNCYSMWFQKMNLSDDADSITFYTSANKSCDNTYSLKLLPYVDGECYWDTNAEQLIIESGDKLRIVKIRFMNSDGSYAKHEILPEDIKVKR